MQKISIKTEFIKLQQFLKLANCVGAGSDAKILIADGMVKVNGSTCLQRGKKIKIGDIIYIQNIGKFEVVGE